MKSPAPDDFGIYNDWTETNVEGNSYTITGLKPDTEYEVELLAVYKNETGDWISTTFTTNGGRHHAG